MKKIITLISVFAFSILAHAQWDTLHTNTTTEFHSVSFPDAMNGLAVGKNPTTSRGAAFYTADAGATWTAANFSTNAPAMNDIAFFSPYNGYAVSDSGQIFTCNVLGMTISAPMQKGSDNLNCIFMASDTVGYIGGDNGVLYKSSDFGQNWNALSSNTTTNIRDIYFSTELSGWIVGDGGLIAYTIDGGQTWTTQPQPYLGFLQPKGISFGGAYDFVVGDAGDMIISGDAGGTWGYFTSVTNFDLNSIRFGNAISGVMCGDSGVIYRTLDGGNTWMNERMSFAHEKLTKVCYANDSTAYICGYNGRILKSNSDISSVHTPVEISLTANAFPNPFTTELHLTFTLKNRSEVNLFVTDLSGRTVTQENFGELNAGENAITPQTISELANGTYLVTIVTAEGKVSLPVIRN